MSAVTMKAQNRHIDCWDQADLLPTTGAMLRGTVMKQCAVADTCCSFSVCCRYTNRSGKALDKNNAVRK